MKIQSSTAKLLKYPALATLVAITGTATAFDKPEQKPAQQTESQTSPKSDKKQTPQPYPGIAAPDSAKNQEEEVPEPQYYLGEIAPEPNEEKPKKQRPSIIPQNTAGSVPRPEE